MPEPGTTEKRASILGSISGTLMLYGLFGLIVEAGLTVVVLQTEGSTRMVTLIGMLVILKIDFRKDVAKGWWLGRDREDTCDIGGPVTWTKAGKWRGEWQNRRYEYQIPRGAIPRPSRPEGSAGFGPSAG